MPASRDSLPAPDDTGDPNGGARRLLAAYLVAWALWLVFRPSSLQGTSVTPEARRELAIFGFSIVFLIAYRHWPDPAGLWWFPVAVIVQLIFTIGLALFVSALTVHYRDIRDLLSNLLMFWRRLK